MKNFRVIIFAMLVNLSGHAQFPSRHGDGTIRISEITASEQQQRQDLEDAHDKATKDGEDLRDYLLRQYGIWPTDDWCRKVSDGKPDREPKECRFTYDFGGVKDSGEADSYVIDNEEKDDTRYVHMKHIKIQFARGDVDALKVAGEKVSAAEKAVHDFDKKLSSDRNSDPYVPSSSTEGWAVIFGSDAHPIYGPCEYELVVIQTKTQLVIQKMDRYRYDDIKSGKLPDRCIIGYEEEGEINEVDLKINGLEYTGTGTKYYHKDSAKRIKKEDDEDDNEQ